MDAFGRIRAALYHLDAPEPPLMQDLHQDRLDFAIRRSRQNQHFRRLRQGYVRLHHDGGAQGEPRVQGIKVEEDVLSYSGKAGDITGLYVAANTIDQYDNYFEVEILDIGDLGHIVIGLVPAKYPMNSIPGVEAKSVGYLADNGRFYINHGRGMFDMSQHGPPCSMGDRMGVGVKAVDDPHSGDRISSRIVFTRNGQEVKSVELGVAVSQLYPAVGMQSEGEEVLLCLDSTWNPEDIMSMMVDCGEEDWVRLDDVRLNGMTLEYTGRGRTIHDVGLAQAKFPLDTTNHYFEFEIVDPGDKCYVAIGLAKQNYPMRRHPGWNDGSIAYHADDGKLFHGSGVGVRFGPKCSMGDIMGCGIYFPPDYDGEADVQGDDDVHKEGMDEEGLWHSDDEYSSSDSDEDIGDVYGFQQKRRAPAGNGPKAKVFFSRNGKIIGQVDVAIPKGGFYPTIGMLTCNEKVRVDLRPLTG